MLTLIKQTDQQKWPIIPSLFGSGGRHYPTIAQYAKNPTAYKTIPHGIYTLEFPVEAFRTYWDKDSYVLCNIDGDEIQLKVSARANVWIRALAKGYLVYNGLTVIVTGKFEKLGSTIIFTPSGQ